MIDLHTHILCGMDDGAPDPQTSIRLLKMQREQGVDAVVLTPHFYRSREHASHFLRRRAEAVDQLQEAIACSGERDLPQLYLGAEVAWVPNLANCDHLEQLCIHGTKNLLLELPMGKWSSDLSGQIYDLMGRTGITPVLAHLDRYLKAQRPELIRDILELEVPVQISSTALLRLSTRAMGLRALREYAHVLATDCHDPVNRKPDLRPAMELVSRKLGTAAAAALDRNARSLITK